MANNRRLPQGTTAEARRLQEARETEGVSWRLWGPYLSERQWGTVREDLIGAEGWSATERSPIEEVAIPSRPVGRRYR